MQPGWFNDPWHPAQIRYFDGQQWTGQVAPIPGGMSPQPQPPQRGELPLGESTLFLRSIPEWADIDLSCSVENAHGQQIAAIRSRSRVPAFAGREVVTLVFDVVRPDGAPMLTITRIGGFKRSHCVQVHDHAGRDLGRLRQTSSFLRLFRTPRMTMVLEFGEKHLGNTDICINPNKRFEVVYAPIHDLSGAVIATVERRWRYTGAPTDFFDYKLDCLRATAQPLPVLLLATAFAHYLYDRLAIGGPTEAMGRFGRTGNWYDTTSK
ncbi:DUF2510 domain-containing protein [Mycobacterium hubeiense]|uniref:DUF2510 domain-containing protein n=1 Tax=Mycobacterium hubeiense TaxID=1867256 RepID=UPI000C7EABB1|nr:DUF2510 domain-containing protein [Mycobacterium sp. QGD 101]